MISNQSRLESLVEATFDMAVGIVVSWCVMLWVIPIPYPYYSPNMTDSFGIVIIFTATSWIRRYLTRRFFANQLHLIVHRNISRFF